MTAGRIEVVVVRHDSTAPAGETTVVRLLGLLPAHWSCTFDVDSDRVGLRIEPAGPADGRAVHRAVSRALSDAALRGWTRES